MCGNAVNHFLAREDVTGSTISADRVQWPIADYAGTGRDLVENDSTVGKHYECDGERVVRRYVGPSYL